MDHKKNTTKKVIFKYAKIVIGQWNIFKKDIGATEYAMVRPSYPTEKNVKIALEEIRERMR